MQKTNDKMVKYMSYSSEITVNASGLNIPILTYIVKMDYIYTHTYTLYKTFNLYL